MGTEFYSLYMLVMGTMWGYYDGSGWAKDYSNEENQ